MSTSEVTDKASLWAQLQEIQRKEMEVLKEEREKLEKEKESMSSVVADGSDIVEFNAGGEIIQAHRKTLCLVPDAMISHLFSGRWDDSCARDKEGRVFLDHDPVLMRFIVNHLRIKRIEDPSHPVRPPKIPEHKEEACLCVLRYFGLNTFSYPGSDDRNLECSGIEVVQPNGSFVHTDRNSGKIRFTYRSGGGRGEFVACNPSLPLETSCCWKVTIDSLPGNYWIFLGVIGKLNAATTSYADSTSYGWGSGGEIYRQGRSGTGAWPGFLQGDCLFFRFSRNRLTMFNVAKSETFSIDNIETTQTYIHFHFYTHSSIVTLEPLSDNELRTFSWAA